jgi:hypothetical protein
MRTSFSFLILALLLSSCASLQLGEPKVLEENPKLADKADPPALAQSDGAKVEAGTSPSDCPVTTPGEAAFEAPAPYSSEAPWKGFFWYGSRDLWTALRTDGIWAGLPDNPEGFTQKIMWWSDKFVLKDENEPALVVSGRRLDAEAPPLKSYGATNAFADDIGEAMLTGVDFPTLGCWEITGRYKEAELTFVVWIAP